MTMIKYIQNVNLQNYHLIIPTVSVGNVAQLTTDILITTLNMTKIGYVWHRNILPLVAKKNGDERLTTACELYLSEECKIVLMQIRSSYGNFSTISDCFSSLCKSVKSVIILTGSYAYEKKDIHLIDDNIQYISSYEKEGLPPIPSDWKQFNCGGSELERLRVPGSGIGDRLYRQCVNEGVPVLLLLEYVSEGDNRFDAIRLASFLDNWLTLRKRAQVTGSAWRTPSDWDALFGNTFPSSIF